MESVVAFQGQEKKGGVSCTERESGYLTPAQLVECYVLAVINHAHGQLEKIKEAACRDSRAAPAQINIHLLICELGDILYFSPRQQVKLLIVELGYVGQVRLHPGQNPLLYALIDHD